MAQQFTMQGRIVFGHPAKPREKKDVRTRQPVIKDGQKVQQYVFGLAIDKNTFVQQVWPYLSAEAKAAFPNGAPNNFSYKYKDGDTNDSKGNPYSKREGYAGHYVLTISTEGFAPQVFKMENGAYRQLAAEEIKCGDYVAVNTTVKYNGAVSPNTPGLYINPNAVLHIGYGNEIASGGQDPDELFAGYQPQQFAGMTNTPQMGAAPLPGAMLPGNGYAPAAPGMPQGGMPNVGHVAPAPSAQPYIAPQQPHVQPGTNYAPQPGAPLPAPAHDFVQNATGQPPAYGQPPQGQPPQYAPAPGAPAYGQPPQYAPPAPAGAPQYAPQYPGVPAGR